MNLNQEAGTKVYKEKEEGLSKILPPPLKKKKYKMKEGK